MSGGNGESAEVASMSSNSTTENSFQDSDRSSQMDYTPNLEMAVSIKRINDLKLAQERLEMGFYEFWKKLNSSNIAAMKPDKISALACDYLVFGLEISQPGCKKYPTPAAQTAPAAPDDFTGGSAHASNQLNQTNQMNQMSESIKRIDELENVQKQMEAELSKLWNELNSRIIPADTATDDKKQYQSSMIVLKTLYPNNFFDNMPIETAANQNSSDSSLSQNTESGQILIDGQPVTVFLNLNDTLMEDLENPVSRTFSYGGGGSENQEQTPPN